jgi:hypothetical protein
MLEPPMEQALPLFLHSDLLRQAFDLPMNAQMAESILTLRLPDRSLRRAMQLNATANLQTLSDDERRELDAYVMVADVLVYWQFKAKKLLSHVSG